MICEGSQFREILEKRGYGFLWGLRQIIYTAHQSIRGETGKKLVVDPQRTPFHFTKKCRIKKSLYSGKEPIRKDEAQHRLIQKGSSCRKLLDNEMANRQTRLWQRGAAEMLTLAAPAVDDPLLQKLQRALSEWKLAPYQMMNELQKDFERLRDPELQSLVLRLLFRSPVTKQGPRLGAGELILQDGALYDNCRAFIEKGLNTFISVKNPVEGGRFFFEFAFLFGKYLAEAGKHEKAQGLCNLRTVERWLALKGLSEEERAALHFCRLLFYAVRPIDSLMSGELSAIYESWSRFRSVPDQKRWLTPALFQMAEEFIAQLTGHLKEDLLYSFSSRNRLMTDIFRAADLQNVPETMEWQEDPVRRFPVFETADRQYKIDLLKGAVYTPQGETGKIPMERPWERQEDFKRIFGSSPNLCYRMAGECSIVFTHPEWGRFRLVKCPSSYRLWKQFPGSDRWYELRKPRAVDGIPEILIADHTFWIPVTKRNEGDKGLFVSLHSHKLKYALKQNGEIVELKSGLSVEGEPNNEALFNFDLNLLRYSERESGQLLRFRFPRYRSQEGVPLAFTQNRGKMVWSENSRYFLPSAMPRGYLGTIPNYLYLKAEKKGDPDKIIVPFRPIIFPETPFSGGKIDICSNEGQEGSKERWDKFTYFVYDVRKEGLQPNCSEGKLFLAALYLTQKRHAEAVRLIRSFSSLEPLSARGEEILKMIREAKRGEDSPDAKMVQLQALFMEMKKREERALSKEGYRLSPEYLWELASSLEDLYQSLANIDADCRFTEEEERAFLTKALEELERKRKAILGHIGDDDRSRFEGIVRHLGRRLEFLKGGKKSPYFGVPFQKERNPDSENRNRKPFRGVSFSLPELPSRDEEIPSFKKELQRRVGWLDRTCGQLPPFATRPLISFGFQLGGKLFYTIYRAAQSGSEDERDSWNFRLKLWKLHCRNFLQVQFLDFCLVLLQNPQEFPPYPDFLADDFSKKAFLAKCEAAYKKVSSALNENGETGEKRLSFQEKAVEEGNFPIPDGTAFDEKEPSLTGEKKLLNPSFGHQTERWAKLQEWSRRLVLRPSRSSSSSVADFSFAFDEKLLSNREKGYAVSLKRDLEALLRDYNAGKEIYEQEQEVLIEKGECRLLGEEAEREISRLECRLQEKMKELLEKANRKEGAFAEKLAADAREEGGAARRVTYEECLRCLLSGDLREYALRNRALADRERAEELASLTLEIVDLKSYLAQLGRVGELSRKIAKIGEPDDPTRRHYCKKLKKELDSRYHFDRFDSEAQASFRVFCGESGMIPYKKQMELIEKMLQLSEKEPSRFKDIVIQLIMGGGKTSVLATLLLHLAAKREGRLALFIVPASLFNTVKSNLNESYLKAFCSEIGAIDLCREEMNSYTLERLYSGLKSAIGEKRPLIAKASTLQTLELELLSRAKTLKTGYEKYRETTRELRKKMGEAEKLRRMGGAGAKRARAADRLKLLEAQIQVLEKERKGWKGAIGQNMQCARLLLKINETIAFCGDALIDEVDLILDCLQEVIFPEGEPVPIDEGGNLLLLEIFKTLTGKELDPLIGLTKNRQSKMDRGLYLRRAAPEVAARVSERFEPIRRAVAFCREEFIRFASGQTPEVLEKFRAGRELTPEALDSEDPDWREKGSFEQLKKDLRFLKRLDRLAQSLDEEEREGADLIALARHLIFELIPETLKKSGKRNYGPKKGAPGKIVPYLAVNTPASTEFGYHWEEACYNYQWAAAFAPSGEQILEIAESAEKMARHYVRKNGEAYEETVEFKEFFKLFNVRLDKIHEKGNLKKAQRQIAQEREKRLELQFEAVASRVAFTPELFVSNGVDLIRQLSSRRAMSGTPWNVEGYARSLRERFEADLGTEGRILKTLAEKKAKSKIYESGLSSIESFLEEIYQAHPEPKKIRGIIEAGGLFKAFKNNRSVASGIMRFIENRPELADPAIEGVLFFDKDPGEGQSDTLYVWKKGAKKPERVGGSSVAALKAKGLKPKNYFTYYDERHTTGTDIPQLPEAVNLFTFDEKMLRRSVGQGIMRLREFLAAQNVDIVIDKNSKSAIYNSAATLNDLILHAEKVQSVTKTEQMMRFFQRQIDAIFREIAVKEIKRALLCSNEKTFCRIYEKMEPFFLTKAVNAPYLQFGGLKSRGEAKEYLLAYLQRKAALFGEAAAGMPAAKEAEGPVSEMAAAIRESRCLPKEWEAPPENLGIEQEVEAQALKQAERQTECEMEIEKELQLELQRYEAADSGSLIEEPKVTLEQFKAMLRDLRAPRPSCRPLRRQLGDYDYSLDKKRIPYEKLFYEPIFGTHAFFHSRSRPLPVFHKLQRPANQILALSCYGGIRWMLLCEREAKSVRNHLKQLYREGDELVEGAWLLQPDGTLLASEEGIAPFPFKEEIAEAGLLEINAFNGNVEYLDNHSELAEEWVQENPELALRFLKLKTARDKKQRELLLHSPIFAESGVKNSGRLKNLRARLEHEKGRKGNYIPESALAAKLCSRSDVRDLNIKYVKYLGIDPDAKDPLTLQALAELEKSSPGCTRKAAESLTARQFKAIKPFQIPHLVKEQIKWLRPDQAALLVKPTQICRFDEKGNPVEFFLSEEQLKGLKRGQKRLVPYINPKFYRKFTKEWLIQAVPSRHIGKLTDRQLDYLSKEQLHSLDKEEVKRLAERLPPEKCGWINGELVAYLPEQKRRWVRPEQIAEIRDPALVRGLSEEWSGWIAPAMVPFIDFKRQLRFLENMEQIQKVPHDKVPQLSRSQVGKISDAQLEWIKEEQVCGLRRDKLLLLRDKIPGQKWDSLRKRITQEQAASFESQEQFDLLDAEQIRKYARTTQVCYMKADWQIRAAAPDLIPFMREMQVKKLSDQQIKKIDNPAGFTLLSDEQLDKIDDPEQIRKIPEHLVYKLKPEQFRIFKTADYTKIQNLRAGQFRMLEDPKQLFCLTAAQVNEWVLNYYNSILGHPNLLRSIPHFNPNTYGSLGEVHQELLKEVPEEKLHFLNARQVEARELDSKWKVAGHIVKGVARTALMPLLLTARMVGNFALTLFSVFKAPDAVSEQFQYTFTAAPLSDLIAPLEIFRPAQYLRLRSQYRSQSPKVLH